MPATTANMGSGFDALGMALALYNRFRVSLFDQDTVACAPGQDVPTPEDHLTLKVMRGICRRLGQAPAGIALWQDCAIPQARGLGSSAACVVAGVMAAFALCGRPLSLSDAVDEATQWEGHPDNVAPAIWGGITVCAMDAGQVHCLHIDAPKALWTVALVPPYPLSTAKARAVLPTEIPLGDGVYNTGRSALLVGALTTGRLELLPVAMQDCLHQPYRKHMIPEWDAVTAAALEAGALAVTLSGAGPTLLAYGAHTDTLDAFRANMRVPDGWHMWPLAAAQGATIVRY